MKELVIDGACILTGAAKRPLIDAGFIRISGDRIVEVSAGSAPDARPGTDRIDARGKLVIPGLVNVHTHAILSMTRGMSEDMGFAPAYTPGVPHGHDVTEDEAVALARLGALEAMLFGSTLINDTYTHQNLTMPAMAELGLRVWGSGRIHDVDFSRVHLAEWEHKPQIGDWSLGEAVALHEALHGKADGRMGICLAPHAPDTCTPWLLKRVREERDRLGVRVQSHLSQSRLEVARIRERDGMSPPELYDELGLLDDTLIAAHCIHVDQNDIQRIGRSGLSVAHIAKGNQTGGTIAPTTALRAAGARFALGTDNCHADMVEVMRWALMSGRVQEGKVTDSWQPSTVFEMATMGGARAMGLANDIGSLEVGKKADLVVLNMQQPHLIPLINPLGNLIHTAQGRDVEKVMVDGRLIVDGGRALLVDQDAIMREAQKAAESLWRRSRAEAN
ncbi:amidohydrolase family protein [Variovorax sp. OV700]|uniref:amidohydrolase family protein n=1 Tax=Variovorax sp. OV700 TaxID=1882826 RepID=UPI000887E4DB|nr:amidohydrolase family protein [Variovorax sp. OV700]SDH54155.1 5-methylthioadenosine/S-adenosylhomocysteine deaminase [Variovorax sp. OV700]